MSGPEVMTVQQAAEYLQVSAETVRRAARTGDLPGARVGRVWRFHKTALERWLGAGGTDYEGAVERGLAEATREAFAEDGDDIPLEEAKARLGL